MSIKKSQIENFLSINIYFEGFPPKFKKSYSGSILLTLLSVLTFSLPSTMVRADVSFVETILDAASSANLQQATDTVVSPDGKFVYVISWGSSSLSVFSRDSSSGLLTFVEELKDGVNGINGLNTLFGIDVSLDGNNIYTIAGGGSDQTISSFKRDSITGKLTLVAEYTEGGNDGKGNTVTGLSCALDLVVSPDGKNVYGLGTGSSSLVVFNRNGTTGELTYSTTFTDGVDGIDGLSTSCSPDAGPINSIAISPDGAYLYNAASGDNSITTWQRDVTTGALTYGNSLIDGIDGSDGLQGITSLIISPDGSTIYTSGQAENKLGVFNRSEVTGNVTFIEVQTDGSNGVNNIAGVRSLAISQDGKFVFASAITDNAITMFDRDNATGALTFNDDVTDSDPGVDGLGGVSGMVVSPENTHIYAAAQSDAAITVFSLPRPGITLSVSNAVFNKHDTALILDSALVLFDTNSINLSSGEVRISSGFITGDILAATGIGSITTSYDANTGVLTLSGIDTLENYQKVLRSVTFIHEGNNPTQDNTVVSRTIIFQIIDDTDLSSVPKVFSLVVNDATVPAAPVVTTPTNAEITSKNPYSISGTHSEDGVTVYLYADSNNDGVADNSTSLASSIVSSNAWSFSVTLTSDAANNFVIKAGNNVDNFSKDVALPTITHSSNNAPVISEGTSITVTMSEDNAPIPFALTLNATDANGGDTLTWSIKSPASTGSVAVSGVDTGSSQVIHYTTNTNFFGSDSFIVGVSDGTVSDTITVNVTIVSVNDIPTIVIGNTLSTDEDNNQTLNFTFDDVDGDTVSATVSTQATNGTASVSGTTVSYVPNENFFGTDSFTLTLMDNAGFTTTQVISVTVNSVNDEPTITIDSTLSTNEDNNQTLNFTFDDVDGDTVSATVSTQATNGTASVSGTTVSYVPNENFFGTDSFTLTLMDNAGFTTTQVISVTVNSVNDEPTITIDSTLSTNEDNNQTLSFTFDDVDGDTVSATVSTQATNGTASVSGTTVSYVPNENFFGTDSFTLTLMDNAGFTTTQVISVTVNSVNDEPTITIDSTLSTNEDNNQTLSFTFDDVDGDTVSATVSTQATNGTASVSGTTVSYVPNENFFGTDSFTLTLMDNAGFTTTQVISVTVNSVNDEPTITIDSTLSTNEDNNQTLSFTFDDVDGDTVSATVSTQATNGTASVSGTTVSYVPNENFFGTDSFTLTLMDNAGFTTTQVISVTVNSVNDEPTITIDSTLSTNEDNNQTLSFTFDDVDGDTVSATVSTQATNGTASVSGTTVSYVPNENFFGTDSFTLTLMDNAGFTTTQVISVTVNSVNDEPTITIDSTLSTNEDNNQTLSFTFDDVDGDTVSATVSTQATNGTASVSGTTVSYVPNENFFGTDSFTLTLMDNAGFTTTQVISVTVNSVNDEPTITIDSTLSTNEDNNQTLNFTFDDVDGDTVSATVSTQATNGTASVSGTTVSYVPNENFFGTDSFTLTLMDNAGFTTTQVISVTVNSVNDEPTITIDSTLSTNEDNNQTLNFTFDDVDGDTVSASVINQASNGVASVTGTTVSYVPNDNFNGSDSFTLLLTDSAGFETIQTINVTVDAVNDMPIAVNDNYTMTVASDGTYTLNVLQNDIDIDNDPLTIEWVSSDLGTVSIVDNEVVLKTDTIGTINLSYGMSDGVDSSVGLVTLITEIAVSEWVDITAPADIEINASGLFTKVNIGSAIAVDSNGEALAVSLDRDSVYFAPGLHTIYWSSEDSKGHKAQVSQKVTVHPMINISKDAQTIEGAEHHIGVYLNGAAPSYPVTIAYTVSGSSDSEDHDLVDGFITIESGTEGVIELSTYKDENTEGQETLIVFLSNTLNLGSHASYELTIDEANIAPDVHITVSQDNEERSTVQNNNDLVTVTANVVDANVEDTHSYHWINDNIDLTNVSNSDDVFEFSAQELTVGYYQLQLEVTDSSDAIVTTNVYIEVVEDLAVLGSQDSDGDLIPDDYEGYGDSDGDGIADYEDAISECNIIQEEALVSESYLVEGESSACLRKGVSVANNNSGGTLLRNYELSSDYNAKNIGGVFDFVIYDLPTAGQTYLLVVPQRLPIPSDAVYRKYKGDGVWGDFQENGKNYLSSARGAKGYCPPPGDSDWLVGLHEGDWCVQIAIEDGGVNDADGLVNSVIVDPGGVSSYSNNTLPEAVDDSASIITGNTINIDVLINDSDVDNDTLSITSASAQFGSVTIERELLRYTSLDDFIGTDVISYGISDGNGGSASAEVTVTVKADTSEVVRNSTGGSMGGLLILILGSFVLIRYQGRIITGGLLILISSNSQANWFIETELGISLADSEWSVDESYVQDSDRTDLAWAIGVGYYLTPDWALTARYLDLGQGSATLSTDNSMDPDKYHEVVAKNSPALVEGVAVEVDYSLLKNEKVNLQATLGLLSWGVDFNSEYQDTHISSSENGIDPYIGIGVDYKLSKKWIAGLAVNQYFIDLNNVTTFSLKLSYLFNSN
ncbi:tandem-95 repeat protein [Psychromonas sp. PT13]|uniref:tandem-95 repeat protein n=1 Tax=Psychromonas sp. PT13 TaxID=3439547 RepID=UPI003EBE2B14